MGRWDDGKAAEAKYTKCAVRNARFSMVNLGPAKHWELYDLLSDPGEKQNVASQHPEQVRAMDAAYDKWWSEILPLLENENAVPPAVSPYKILYWKQFWRGTKRPLPGKQG